MKRILVAAATLATGSVAFAAAPVIDYSGLTGNIDLTSTTAAIMAVGAIAVGFNVAKGGAKAILGFIRGAVK